MQSFVYDEVRRDDELNEAKSHKMAWLPYIRQMCIITGVMLLTFSLGLSFGAPTVIIAQVRREANSTQAVSTEMESWLSSVHGYSALPFIFITPISAQRFGRKIPFILVCLSTVVANIVLYWSTNTIHILISEIIYGVLLGSNMTLLIPIVTEYSSPHFRAMIFTIKSSVFFLGMWVANIIGTFFHWRIIGIIGLVCCVYSVSSVFWPESPSWLAMKGRYDEAATVHHWLKGYDDKSETELQDLIISQKEYRKTHAKRTPKTIRDRFTLVMDTITTKIYYYPLLLTTAIMSLYHFSGKLVCMMYAVQLIHQITNNEQTAYIGMLLLEGITILGMSFGCFLSKFLIRKALFIGSSATGVVFLYIIAIYLYLIHLGYFVEDKIASLLLLSIFSICISCGVIILASPIFGEIVSLQYKCSTLLIMTIYSEILSATVLKLAPSIFRTFSLHGAFLFYGIFASIFIVLLYIYLPETKGKSLQEIENLFKTQRTLDVTRNLIELINNES